MVFNSTQFLIFFPIVVLVYLIIPKRVRYIWLLAASYYFYMCWNKKYIVLILFSTIVTYAAGLLIEKAESVKVKKWIIAGGFTLNLGVLFFFKYFDFALLNLNRVLSILHIEAVDDPFNFLLPVGISFYTFQALGYMIDVYRGDCKAIRNPFKYALFVSFFPQLVAGPIERSKNLISQIESMDTKFLMSFDRITKGFAMMVWGMFMKMVIADRAAIFVDNIFEYTYALGTFDGIAGALGFAVQIYCDFGGYSAIALGAAAIMGFDLMENFNTPYFATGIADFWRRWHISLSTWFRDYLYIPLGGNRCSKLKKYRNVMITFLVSGLWHGAAWNYVVWGGLHGFYQIVEDLISPVKEKAEKALRIKTDNFSYKFGNILVTFAFTCFAWIFFRAPSFSEALHYIKRMFTNYNPWILFNDDIFRFGLDIKEMSILIAAVALLLIADIIRYVKGLNPGEFLYKQNLWFRWAVLIILVVVILVYGEYGIDFDSNSFIYFDF
ncbi:MAG: MBOAT family protein [Lachnospiraceae bacterium]|nr:MBOAT family protein [Lachnospiraceae bacterium]